MNKKKLKQNKGFSMVDIIIAMLVLIIFTGTITTLYYQITLNNNLMQMDSMAVYYAVKVAEDIDEMPYDQVTNTLQDYIKSNYKIPEMFNILIDVENYNEDDASKKDILKLVSIKIEYTCLNTERKYELKKLKVKEI